MSTTAIRIGKTLTATFWLLVLLSLILPALADWQRGLLMAAGIILLLHAVECLAFSGRVKRQATEQRLKHYVGILVYGYFHAIGLSDDDTNTPN